MAVTVKRSGMLLALVGPTGGGKTTHAARLLKHFGSGLQLSVSATTRSPRPGETEGVSYYFLSPAAFREKIEAGEFYEHEEIHGNLYGTLKSVVSRSVAEGIDLLLDIDIKGALRFKRQLPGQTVVCFLLPPSREVLLDRLERRGGVSEAELDIRLQTARLEYEQLISAKEQGGLVDYVVVNDNADETFLRLSAIVEAERCRLGRYDDAAVRALCVI